MILRPLLPRFGVRIPVPASDAFNLAQNLAQAGKKPAGIFRESPKGDVFVLTGQDLKESEEYVVLVPPRGENRDDDKLIRHRASRGYGYTNDQIKNFDTLTNLIRKHGEIHPKRHGNWIKLNFSDGLFLSMDSWNHAVHLQAGSGEYNYATGFSGKSLQFVGLEFGGYRIDVDNAFLESLIAQIQTKFSV